VPENAALIESLLAEARNRDAAVEDLKKTAVYAGDEDPYVKPRVIADEDDDEFESDEPDASDEPNASDEPDVSDEPDPK
jgi:ribosome-binding factor A